MGRAKPFSLEDAIYFLATLKLGTDKLYPIHESRFFNILQLMPANLEVKQDCTVKLWAPQKLILKFVSYHKDYFISDPEVFKCFPKEDTKDLNDDSKEDTEDLDNDMEID